MFQLRFVDVCRHPSRTLQALGKSVHCGGDIGYSSALPDNDSRGNNSGN